MNRRRRPTAAVVIPVLAATGFLSLASLTGSPWLVLLAGACIGLPLAATLTRHRLGNLSVSLTGPSRVAVGGHLTQHLQVRNTGGTASDPVMVTVSSPGLDTVRVHVGRLAPGEQAEAEVVRPATHRGVHEGSTLLVETAVVLGLLVSRRRVDRPVVVVVHPRAVPPLGIPPVTGPGDDEVDPRPGPGLELSGIREWRWGDDARRVHWRSTARRGRLVVMERGEDRAPVTHLVVVGPSGGLCWEPLVEAAAATSLVAGQDGRQVAVTAWGQNGPLPATAGSRAELLDWWAALGEVGVPSPADLVATRGGHRDARALVVVGCAHLPPGWWNAVRGVGAAAGLSIGALVVDVPGDT